MMETDALFPERDEIDAACAAGIAEACERLDCAHEWIADDGFEHEIVGGAVDGARVAWVEKRARSDGGWEDVEYRLRMRAGDVLVREWVVDTYNPHFGCAVGYLRWWGEDVVVIYGEKHETIACALGPSGAPRLLAIDHAWQVLGDVLLYASDARGLVERMRLPELERRAPLLTAAAQRHLVDGTVEHGPAHATMTALLRQVAGRLPEMPEPFKELLVGALAYRLWDAWPPLVATYDEAYSRDRWNTPCWLPYYDYCASEGAAASERLGWIEVAAARADAAYGPEEEVAELACRHIAARCRELAAACRARKLPEGTCCYFWVEWSQAAFADWQALFPAGMWATWQALRPRARELARLGERR